MKNKENEINQKIFVKSYIANIIPFVILILIIFSIGDSWYALFFISGAYILWLLLKAIIQTIFFQLFLKKDFIKKYVSIFEENDFPIPGDFDINDNPSLYLESIALNAEFHPQNIIANSILCEINHARARGSFLILFRLNNVIKKSLKIYQHKLKLNKNRQKFYEN